MTFDYKKALYFYREFLTNRFMAKIAMGKVPVLVEDKPEDKFYWIDCDESGYPIRSRISYITTNTTTNYAKFEKNSTTNYSNLSETTIQLTRALIFDGYDSGPKREVFMWEGVLISIDRLEIEKMDIKYLMNLVNDAIEKREHIIIDEVLKQKLYI